jgi:DNA polymerase I-like protein with 3'-5' exonuclease and polymerase domains
MNFPDVKPILVDQRNWEAMKPLMIERIKAAPFVGADFETHDQDAHQGIKTFRGSKTTKAFDMQRTTITGISLYPDETDQCYYMNTAHADVENRLPLEWVLEVLREKPKETPWIAHNAPYEIVAGQCSWDIRFTNIICTMQMCVSAYGPDEYDINKFANAGLGDMRGIVEQSAKTFAAFEQGKDMNPEQADLFKKIIGKASTATHSYNGFIKKLAYGYGLKQAVASWFGYKMQTFDETLGDKAHMGELTGEEVVSYGCDDSVWCVRLFHRLLQHMIQTNPAAVDAFFNQENPMVQVYADCKIDGLAVNEENIKKRRILERKEGAKILRDLKETVKKLLPFPEELHAKLAEVDIKWYGNDKGSKYRKRIAAWADLPQEDDDFKQAIQCGGAVATPWAKERGHKGKLTGPNFTHYMMMRTLIYDLMEQKLRIKEGKVQSDGESRGGLIERLKKQIAGCEHLLSDPLQIWTLKDIADAMRWTQKDPRSQVLFEKVNTAEGIFSDAVNVRKSRLETSKDLIENINKLAGVEQRMKLYLNPYTLLTDPDTKRMYPSITSMLASRRMAGSNPNPMQLAKRGESTYVRGFYLPDEKEHLLISIDWSQIELVLIGDMSGDAGFKEAYGQLPYQDLHMGAAADCLSVVIPEVTEELLLNLHHMETEEVMDLNPKILLDVNGNEMTPGKARKYWRTEVGKGANFNYWYSGALATVGQKLGWTTDQMWEATERYRTRFAQAEAWRKRIIELGKQNGYVTLPDGHRRTRYEATPQWAYRMHALFEQYGQPGITKFGNEIIRATQTRANNQHVNSMVQGTCATLAKRSILKINDRIKAEGFNANFKIPVHDELVFSVHHSEAVDFIAMAKTVMCDHKDIITDLKVDATAAIGQTFEPFHGEKARDGQIELDEAPELPCLPESTVDQKLNREEQQEVVTWIMEQRKSA